MKSAKLPFSVCLLVGLAAILQININANAAQVRNSLEQPWPTAVFLPIVRNDATATPTPTVAPTPTTAPTPTVTPVPTDTPVPPVEPTSTPTRRACCKICTKGKACGDTCIRRDHTCHVGPGCACNGGGQALGDGEGLAANVLYGWRDGLQFGGADLVRCASEGSDPPDATGDGVRF